MLELTNVVRVNILTDKYAKDVTMPAILVMVKTTAIVWHVQIQIYSKITSESKLLTAVFFLGSFWT